MNLSSYQLKKQARSALGQNYAIALLVCFIASLLTNLGTDSLIFRFSYNYNFNNILDGFSYSFNPLGSISSIIGFIIGGALSVGLASHFLHLIDNNNPQFSDLFAYFKYFGNTFVMHFLTGLFIALWSLLLIIPGIIAAYSYALAPYILAEHPEIKASEAIKMSKKMMTGHKGELFVLDLSFIGWYLLCILTLGIGFIFIDPYVKTSKAAFFNEVSGKNYQRSLNNSQNQNNYNPDSSFNNYTNNQQNNYYSNNNNKLNNDDFHKNNDNSSDNNNNFNNGNNYPLN